MMLAVFAAVAVAMAVGVDTLLPLGSRSGLGVRRGAAQRAVAALRDRHRVRVPTFLVTDVEAPGVRARN